MTKILLVEDNDMLQDILSARLEMRGYKVSVTDNGLEALKLVAAAPPDLILMDMSLPFMNGWDTTKKLKDDPTTQHIPIIALTAHALVSDRQRGIEAGCDEYETKPVKFDRLIEKIQILLERNQP
ncbi:MAG: response regulator [Chloroflexi bacterium]|nr:response regulator [Chloroflexota bacterium]